MAWPGDRSTPQSSGIRYTLDGASSRDSTIVSPDLSDAHRSSTSAASSAGHSAGGCEAGPCRRVAFPSRAAALRENPAHRQQREPDLRSYPLRDPVDPVQGDDPVRHLRRDLIGRLRIESAVTQQDSGGVQGFVHVRVRTASPRAICFAPFAAYSDCSRASTEPRLASVRQAERTERAGAARGEGVEFGPTSATCMIHDSVKITI